MTLVASVAHAQTYLDTLINSVHHLSIPLIAVFSVSAVMLIFNIESVFNRIWQVPQGRHSIKAFFTYLLIVFVMPLCISVLYLMRTYFHHYSLPVEGFVHYIPHYLNMSSYLSFSLVLAIQEKVNNYRKSNTKGRV